MKPVQARVTLVQHTADPEELIAAAARLCYAEQTDAILQQDPDGAGKFVAMLKKLGHLSPIEHASFTFLVEGVSRAMTHQLVRHRLASYSQRSQRYVQHAEFDYVVPPRLAGKTVQDAGQAVDAVEYFRQTMEFIADRYRKLNDALGASGESGNEDARYVLPNACETKIFVTMNARELLHFFEERLCLRAQWEIRGVAEQMLAQAGKVAPSVFAGAGPKCIRAGRCPEDKMTCGQYAEVKLRYAAPPGPQGPAL
jgi:thymidylate synthase (FAD)